MTNTDITPNSSIATANVPFLQLLLCRYQISQDNYFWFY